MQRESYWDYMGRRRREERSSVFLNSVERDLSQRVEELEHKIILLGGDPKQLELDL